MFPWFIVLWFQLAPSKSFFDNLPTSLGSALVCRKFDIASMFECRISIYHAINLLSSFWRLGSIPIAYHISPAPVDEAARVLQTVASLSHYALGPVALASLVAFSRYLHGVSVLLRMSSAPKYQEDHQIISFLSCARLSYSTLGGHLLPLR